MLGQGVCHNETLEATQLSFQFNRLSAAKVGATGFEPATS